MNQHRRWQLNCWRHGRLIFVLLGAACALSSVQAQTRPMFRTLVEQFEYLTPEQVAQIYRQLNQTEQLELSIYTAFGSLVHMRACQADMSLAYVSAGSVTDCQQEAMQWMQTLQFSGGNEEQATSYAFSQRNQLLIGMRCSSGEIDAASCGAYMGGVQNYNNMMNDTNQLIIDNMGGGRCDNPGGYTPEGDYCAPRQ